MPLKLCAYATVVLGCACFPAIGLAQGNHTATLFFDAYTPTGAAMSISDFVDYTHYIASPNWQMYSNYGFFPMGTQPATVQLGSSNPVTGTLGGVQYTQFTVPSNQSLYFVCLWRAPVIGTVFMRADNSGQGFTLTDNQTLLVQLPYEFALTEYALANQIFSGASVTFSFDTKNRYAQATTLLQNAKSASTASARALASYQALAVIMPLKERLVLEISNTATSKSGHRNDFVLNYEGFGSWTDSNFSPFYTQSKAAGFTQVLTGCDWTTISPSPGTYNFTGLDFQVNQAIALGYTVALNVNPSLGQMPAWVNNLSFADLQTLYFENARRVVDQYKDKVAIFYPVAELELGTNGHTLAQMAELVRQGLNGARTSAPSVSFGIYLSAAAYVSYEMNPPTAGFFSSWDLVNYLAQNNIKPDFLGLEMQYATVFAPLDLQRVQEVLQAYHNVAQLPVYIGETGYSSKSEDYGLSGLFYWHGGLTQQDQADWADGNLRLSYGASFIKGMYWVHLDPDNNDRGSDFLSSLLGTGLFRFDGPAKKSYTAFKSFSDQIATFVPGTHGAATSIAATAGVTQSAKTNAQFSTALQATVVDFLGNGVPNVMVTFTAPASGASGTFPGSALSAMSATDSTGVATASAFTANATAGSFSVNATFSGGGTTAAAFSLTNTVVQPTLSVNRKTLNFQTSGSLVTSPQTILVTITGGNAPWTATSDHSNITVNPGSGSGTGTFQISASAGSGGVVTVTSIGAINSPQSINVNVTSVTPALPFGSFDTPLNNTTGVVGAIPVTGWALDSIEVTRVDILREPVTGEPAGTLIFIGTAVFSADARPDVQAMFPAYPYSYRAGWGYQMLTNFLPNASGSGAPGTGTYKLHAIAFDKSGSQLDLGTRTIVVDNAHAAKPFGTIDTPGQGGTISGVDSVNFGWALTPQTAMIPIDGSTITVVIDGVLVGHPVYGNFRSDIANLFPGYANSMGAVGFYHLNTTTLANGVHTISWNAFDNLGRGEGLGSRYFNVVNTGGSVAAPEDAIPDSAAVIQQPDLMTPDGDGGYSVTMEEVGRIELHLGAASGNMLVQGEAHALPTGSTLKGGVFYWQPGPGFLGEYTMQFERPDGTRISVRVNIVPKRYSIE